MSLPRPSGLKAPSKIGKPSGLPYPKSGPELPNPPPPADDFIIGDRVWVSGTKPGFIAFLGETQFAAGEWAGVVLDKPEGKNDGSVQNIRYFQCEPKRGVFARISKLSRTPGLLPSVTPKPEDSVSETGTNSMKGAPNGSGLRPTTPILNSARSQNKSPPTSSLNLAPRTSSTPSAKGGLKIGDRVLVSGTKTGTLRFIGATDFAKGEWAGVELDEKQGKNDGAVAGKRYFECRPMFGLFAPVHKVAKLMSGPSGVGTGSTTPSPQARSLMNTSLRLTRERSGSQESVSSISSSASSVSRSRVRLGVTSLSNQLPLRRLPKQSPSPSAKTSQRPSTLNLSATTAALQKALKEKEEHIEQLLRERDLERSEVARAAAQMDEAEGQMTSMRTEHEKFKEDADETLTKLKAKIENLEKEKSDLSCKLEDERRRVEDLQFQIEEEAITKDDLESRTEEEEARLKELERNYKKEKERADKQEQEMFGLKAMLKDQTERLNNLEDTNTNYLDQIEELTHKLSQSENKVRVFESTRLEEGAKTSQVSIELEEKTSRVSELEDILSTRNREIKDLHTKLMELNDELKNGNLRKQKMQDTIDNLTEQLHSSGDASNHLSLEIQNLKSQISDLQRRLDSSQEKEKQVSIEKNKLEEQMSEMMRNSGDSSKRLSLLNDQITERNRKIQDLQDDLSNSTQKWGKLSDEVNQLKTEKEREKEALINQHEKAAKTLHSQVEDLQQALEKANKKMKEISEDLTKDKEDAINRKISELNQMKKQLEQSKEELEKQEVQTQAHKQVLDTITMEKEAITFEKEKAEKHVKRLETEKDTINTELIHARVEVTKIQSQYEKTISERDSLTEQLQEIKTESEDVAKSKKELQKQKDTAVSEKEKVMETVEGLQRDVMENKAMLQQKDMTIEELQKEVEKLRTETQQQQEKLSSLTEQESTAGELQAQLIESKSHISELQKSLQQAEGEMDAMKTQLEFSALVAEERKRLEDQNHQLTKDVDSLQSRFSRELEKQETARTSLQTELDNSSKLLQQRLEEAEEHKQQIANLKNENTSLEAYRTSVTKLESERQELKEKIRILETAVVEAKETAAQSANADVSGDTVAAKLQQEKESAESQVDFLNSVIADLQSKNQELKIRLEAMESGAMTNGADSSMESETPSRRAPPRLFCDICDVFDQHDTDDCPLQAMDYEDDAPSPSQHHGDRKHMRPYCDICEEFHEQCLPPTDELDIASPVQINVIPESDSFLQGDDDVPGSKKCHKSGPLDFIFGSEKNNSSAKLYESQSVVYHTSDDSVEFTSVAGGHGNVIAEAPLHEDRADRSFRSDAFDFKDATTTAHENEQIFSELQNESFNDGTKTSDHLEPLDTTGNAEECGDMDLPGATDECSQRAHSPESIDVSAATDSDGCKLGGIDVTNTSVFGDAIGYCENKSINSSSSEEIDVTSKKSEREEYLEAIKELSGQKADPCDIQDPLGLLTGDTESDEGGASPQNSHKVNQFDEENVFDEKSLSDKDDAGGDDDGKVDTISSDTGAEFSAQDRTSTSEDFLSGRESVGGSTEDVSDIADDEDAAAITTANDRDDGDGDGGDIVDDKNATAVTAASDGDSGGGGDIGSEIGQCDKPKDEDEVKGGSLEAEPNLPFGSRDENLDEGKKDENCKIS